MDGRRALLFDPRREEVPVIPRAPLARAHPVGERLRLGWALALGLGGPITFLAGAAIEPAPADPEASVPLVVAAGALVYLFALVAVAVAAAVRHPVAAPACVVAGAVDLAFALSCPVSGHHTYGLWWVGRLALGAAMVGLGAAALGRRARTSD